MSKKQTLFEIIDALISSSKARYMNNAKWKKLFLIIDGLNIRLPETRWKFVADDRIFKKGGLPREYDFTDTGLRDGGFGPHEFKEIEYIQIPRFCADPGSNAKRPLPVHEMPLEKIKEALNNAGKFPVSIDDDILTIKGYDI